MSEAENHPPASSVTTLRIPIIKKGEYDLWCMKMRQYIAITDHILWDIITNGDQATIEPTSSSSQPSAPKTSIVVNARRNNEKALNILLSAIPDRHLLSFHDAQDARSLWAAIKARFGGNKESKKMQKNLLKQQFETFVVGAREELDFAYERFQNIISMLELYDAKVSCEDANLKFLRSLPSVWHVVATMIRGQPGLDELDFDDLYNNLKVYEHELKGASSSNSQSIAFMSAEIKGSTSRQSTADDKSEIITKGYAQASSSKLKETLNSSFNSDEIICSFFAQQASMPETHDDEDLLQIDDDAMEEIDIRWQVAMITARIRKFMRKTGRPIDLKPKNGITFDKSKIECFNCQKLGHFARECKFAKYQANRANGSKEKRIVPIEDSNSKALVAKDSQGEIDWTKEFDDDPVTFAMVALNGIEEDDWSIEIDADHVDLGQDGLGVFDWSEEADNAPVALALMATSSTDSSNSEVPYCSNCSKSYKKLLNDYQTEKDNFQRARLEIQGYQLSLESLEVIIRTHEKNEYAWGDKYELMDSYGLEAFWQQIEKELADACDTGLKVIKTVLVFVITTAIDRGRFMLPMDNLGGYVAFGTEPKGGRITGKGNHQYNMLDLRITEDESYFVAPKIGARKLQEYQQIVKRAIWVSRITFYRLSNKIIQSGYRKGRLEPCLQNPSNQYQFWAEAVPTACYVLNRKENQVDTAVIQSQFIQVDFEDVDDQQFIVYGSSSIGNKAVSEAITNDAQNMDSDEKKKKAKKFLIYQSLMMIFSDKERGNFIMEILDDENKDTEEEIDLDLNNMDNTINVSSSSTLRIHKNHPQRQIIGPTASGVKTRKQLQGTSTPHQALLSFICKQNRTNHKDQQTCLFACFLSQEEPKKITQALQDESWVEAMQEELLQFKLQNINFVWKSISWKEIGLLHAKKTNNVAISTTKSRISGSCKVVVTGLINVVKNDEPIATFKGRTACIVWTLKEALMLFLRGEYASEIGRFCYLIRSIILQKEKYCSDQSESTESALKIQQFWNTAKERIINEVRSPLKLNVMKENESTSGANLRTDPSDEEKRRLSGPSTFKMYSDDFIQG
ncbi:ribonuclease H-like domain-containing protein [Tanacetum coccineum]